MVSGRNGFSQDDISTLANVISPKAIGKDVVWSILDRVVRVMNDSASKGVGGKATCRKVKLAAKKGSICPTIGTPAVTHE